MTAGPPDRAAAGACPTAPGPSPERTVRRRTPVAGLVCATVLVGMLPLLVRRVGDPDFFWHMAMASFLTTHRGLPSVDLFTFTRQGVALGDHEWLGELALRGLQSAGGDLAVSLGLGLVTVAGFLMILARMRTRRCNLVIATAALGMGGLLGANVWGPRLQMVTFALVALELLLIERYLVDGHRGVLAMPAVTVVWANTHGAFVVGPALLALAAAVEAARALSGVTAAATRARLLGLVTAGSVAGSLLTPFGLGGFTYAVRTQFDPLQETLIAEWRSPDFHALAERGLEGAIVLLVVGFAVSRRAPLWEIATAVLGTLLALQSVRHAALFTVLAVPVIAWRWDDAWRTWPGAVARRLAAPPRGWLSAGAALAAGLCLASIAVDGRLLAGQAASTRANYPVAASDWLAAHPASGNRIFNLYGWGGYLITRFYPGTGRRVFAYEEADHMGDAVLGDYLEIVDLDPGWQGLLSRARVDVVVFPPRTPLTGALDQVSGWRLVYGDAVADVFLRTAGPATSAAAAAWTPSPRRAREAWSRWSR